MWDPELTAMEGDRNWDPGRLMTGDRVVNFDELGPNNETVRSSWGRITAEKTGNSGGGARWPSARRTDLQGRSGSGLEGSQNTGRREND
jgi:hypothetical protein